MVDSFDLAELVGIFLTITHIKFDKSACSLFTSYRDMGTRMIPLLFCFYSQEKHSDLRIRVTTLLFVCMVKMIDGEILWLDGVHDGVRSGVEPDFSCHEETFLLLECAF